MPRVLLFLCACATALVPAAGARAEGARALDVSALSFSVSTARIVLGETQDVEVLITARSLDGVPLDAAPPRLVVSTGSVSAPERTGPGAWRTVYTPPAERFPHVAILFGVIDTATTSSVGFVPLHLWGKGQTVVRTKAKSKVTVFIGNESFGPVDADAEGAARVPITVPPGPEHAVARSVDDLGNESQKSIDLGVPPFNRLAMMPLDDVAAADGAGQARLLAFVVDKKGAPLFSAELAATATTGTVDAAEGVAPGMFRLVYRPGSAAKGTARIDVVLKGSERSRASVDVELLTGRPARARITSDKAVLTADDARTLAVDVRLFDSANNPVPGQAATVDVDVGRIERVEPLSGGGRRAVWVLPAQTTAPRATLTSRLASGDVLGTFVLTLLPGKPARLVLQKPAAVVADGASSVELFLRVTDAAGNQLVPTGAVLEVPSARGQIVAGTVDKTEDGLVYRARYVPVPLDHNELVVITGRLGGLETQQRVELIARPRARLLVGPGLIANVVNNNAGLLGVGPELSLLVRLPGFDGAVHAGVETALLQSVFGAGVAGGPVDRRDFPIFAEGAWRPLLTPDLVLHLGGGAGLVLSDITVGTGSGARRVVEPSIGAQAVVGVAYRLGPGFIEADLRAGYALGLSRLDSAPIGLGLVVGYRFGI